MRFTKWMAAATLCLLMLLGAGALGAQADVYQDPQGRYSMPIPAGWTASTEGDTAQLVNPDGSATLNLWVVQADDVRSGITAALTQLIPDFAAQPVQSNDITLPGGIVWTQKVYVLESGDLLVALGTIKEGSAYVMTVQSTPAALATATPALNTVVLGFSFTGGVSAADALPDYVDPSTFIEHDVTLVSGDFQLSATLTLPNGEGPFPAVVFVHGSGAGDRNESIGLNKPFRDLAQGLATQGIASLRYDKRTLVYRDRREQLTGLTIDGETTDDAVAAIEMLRATSKIDPDRVFVIGHSQGAALAPRIALHSGHAAGIIMMAGNARQEEVMLADQLAYIASVTPQTAEATEDPGAPTATPLPIERLPEQLAAIRGGADPLTVFNGNADSATYWSSLIAVDQVTEAQSLDIPILILQGERDYQITMEDFALWQEALAGHSNVTFKSYPTLTHLFIALGDPSRKSQPQDYNEAGFVAREVIDDIANWIKAQ